MHFLSHLSPFLALLLLGTLNDLHQHQTGLVQASDADAEKAAKRAALQKKMAENAKAVAEAEAKVAAGNVIEAAASEAAPATPSTASTIITGTAGPTEPSGLKISSLTAGNPSTPTPTATTASTKATVKKGTAAAAAVANPSTGSTVVSPTIEASEASTVVVGAIKAKLAAPTAAEATAKATPAEEVPKGNLADKMKAFTATKTETPKPAKGGKAAGKVTAKPVATETAEPAKTTVGAETVATEASAGGIDALKAKFVAPTAAEATAKATPAEEVPKGNLADKMKAFTATKTETPKPAKGGKAAGKVTAKPAAIAGEASTSTTVVKDEGATVEKKEEVVKGSIKATMETTTTTTKAKEDESGSGSHEGGSASGSDEDGSASGSDEDGSGSGSDEGSGSEDESGKVTPNKKKESAAGSLGVDSRNQDPNKNAGNKPSVVPSSNGSSGTNKDGSASKSGSDSDNGDGLGWPTITFLCSGLVIIVGGVGYFAAMHQGWIGKKNDAPVSSVPELQ